MTFNLQLHKFQSRIFDIIIFTTWFLYILIVLGISANAPEYLDDIQFYVKLYVSLFLIYRFNPFRHVKFTRLDARIAFSAGMFLLFTTIVNSTLHTYFEQLKQYLEIFRIK